MGIEVAEGGGECERWIGKHEGGGESGHGREEAGADGEKEGGHGGGAETSVGVEDECSVGDVADDGDGCGGEADQGWGGVVGEVERNWREGWGHGWGEVDGPEGVGG